MNGGIARIRRNRTIIWIALPINRAVCVLVDVLVLKACFAWDADRHRV